MMMLNKIWLNRVSQAIIKRNGALLTRKWVGWTVACNTYRPSILLVPSIIFVLGIFYQSDEANFCQNFTFIHLSLKIIGYDHLHCFWSSWSLSQDCSNVSQKVGLRAAAGIFIIFIISDHDDDDHHHHHHHHLLLHHHLFWSWSSLSQKDGLRATPAKQIQLILCSSCDPASWWEWDYLMVMIMMIMIILMIMIMVMIMVLRWWAIARSCLTVINYAIKNIYFMMMKDVCSTVMVWNFDFWALIWCGRRRNLVVNQTNGQTDHLILDQLLQ